MSVLRAIGTLYYLFRVIYVLFKIIIHVLLHTVEEKRISLPVKCYYFFK